MVALILVHIFLRVHTSPQGREGKGGEAGAETWLICTDGREGGSQMEGRQVCEAHVAVLARKCV